MCGISAVISLHEKDLSFISAMNQEIAHRGPDDEGFVFFSNDGRAHCFGGDATPDEVFASPLAYCPKDKINEAFRAKVALGHRRLSILDLSPSGHQPMSAQGGKTWLIFNGEIYNFKEIRDLLSLLGHRFETEGDTEVILKAYEQFGSACLEHFNGMFSFVLYDASKRSVIAARDRFGVKPLYFWISPEEMVVFASEIKQFTRVPGWKAKLHMQSAYDFLAWGVTDHSRHPFFSGVQEVQPGEIVEISLDLPLNPRTTKWYTLQPKFFEGSSEKAAERYLTLLKDAVRLRLRADVPLGACLSGGLDSSSIVCLTDQLLKENASDLRQKTFSSLTRSPHLSEEHHIATVCQHLSLSPHMITPNLDEMLDTMDALIWHQDLPFASTSIFAQWMLFKTIRQEGVKVVLDGQGADEQLAGYPGFLGNRLFDLLKAVRLRTLYKEACQSQGSWPLLFNKLTPERFKQPLRKVLGKSCAEPSWLDASLPGFIAKDPFLKERKNTVFDQSYLQLTKSNLPMLLRYEDRDSMAHSVESRTPFLDFRLVEFTLGLPSDYKISEGWSKSVLRKAMKGILPESIRLRKDKIGFATDEQLWLKQGQSHFEGWIKEAIECSFDLIKPEALSHCQKIFSGELSFSHLPWRMISFGQWAKKYSVSS